MRRSVDWKGCFVLVAGLLAWPVHAAGPDVFGLKVSLPFDYVQAGTSEVRRAGRTFSLAQWHRIDVPDPDGGQARKLQLVVTYIVPQGVSDTLMRETLDNSIDENAAKPGVRASTAFVIDDFRFHFIDGPVENRRYPERMTISGVVNGAMLHLSVQSEDASLLTPELATSLRAARLDYPGLMKARPEFEAESRMAVLDDTLDTPLSRLTLDRGIGARLTASYIKRDAAGQPVFRYRSFGLFKSGFWTMQGLALMVGCGSTSAFDDEDAGAFLDLSTDEDSTADPDDWPTRVSPPQPAVLAGLPARMVTAKGGKIAPARRTDLRRWQAMNDGFVYQAEIERINGSPVEKQLLQQLEGAEPMCQLGLQFAGEAGP